MWTFLYSLASPRTFYQRMQVYLPVLACLAVGFLLIGSIWGLVFAPADYQQGDAFRIIYVHVPTAFMSLSVYAIMSFCSLLLLVWRIKLAGMLIKQWARTGFLMAFLALVTGSLWGKPMWGAYWVWDARLTSELILLLLYAAILVLASSFENKEQADKLAAILTLVGVVDLPVIHYSVYWWNTLHQGATFSLMAKPKIAAPMLYPLLFMLLGFFFYCLWITLQRACSELLLRERKQHWVKALLTEEPL